MLGGNHLEKEESEYGGSSRRSNSPNFNVHENNEENPYPNSRANRSSNSAEYGNNSAGTDSSAELNRLSGELNLKISREMDEMMNNDSAQFQRTKIDAIGNQVLPQIQNALEAGLGSLTQKGWTSRLRDRNNILRIILVRKLGVVPEVSQLVTVFVTIVQKMLMTVTVLCLLGQPSLAFYDSFRQPSRFLFHHTFQVDLFEVDSNFFSYCRC